MKELIHGQMVSLQILVLVLYRDFVLHYRPRHIHMNAPKIRILQKKIIFATTKFEFESAN